MDIEFHYYITHLIAARAGLPPEDARILAWSSQHTDDNDRIFEIDPGLPTAYGNYISQTMNILYPRDTLVRIYPLFHFIPGNPMSTSAWRKDGGMHWLNTTPDSENANLVLDAALASGSLYRIGIACHGYADTWAHQNFVGYDHDFNTLTNPLAALTAVFPSVGHAQATHDPDRTALIWQDERLIHERIDNKARFLAAARGMLWKLAPYADPKMTKKEIRQREATLTADLDRCIGPHDPDNVNENERIDRYEALAQTPSYGGSPIAPYDARQWMDEAVDTAVRGLRDRGDFPIAGWDPLKDLYRWKDRDRYRQTHWHRFQEAVKAHQNETWALLENRSFQGLELENL